MLAAFLWPWIGRRGSEGARTKMTTKATSEFGVYLRDVGKKRATRVVLGNEASDMDSVVSSVVYAFITRNKGTVAPVLAIQRSELPLRADVQLALRDCGICESWIQTTEEMGHDELQQCEVALVDHNSLAPRFEFLKEKVCAVVDHHRDEGEFKDATPRVIAAVGSCSTLVAEAARECGSLCTSAARLLLAGQLLDVGVGAKGDRGTSRDAVAHEWLINEAGINKESLEKWMQDLSHARLDVDGLTGGQLLRRDSKLVEIGSIRVAIASIPTAIRRVSENELNEYALEAGVETVMVLSRVGSQRETLLWGDTTVVQCISEAVKASAHIGWKKRTFEWEVESQKTEALTLYFSQSNSAVSRKQILPLVNEAIRALTASANS